MIVTSEREPDVPKRTFKNVYRTSRCGGVEELAADNSQATKENPGAVSWSTEVGGHRRRPADGRVTSQGADRHQGPAATGSPTTGTSHEAADNREVIKKIFSVIVNVHCRSNKIQDAERR